MLPITRQDPDIEINSSLSKITALSSDLSLLELSKEYCKAQEALFNKKNSKRALRKGTKTFIVSTQLIQEIRSIHEFLIFGGVQVTIDDEIHLQSNLQAMNIGSIFQNPMRIAIQNSIQRIDCQTNRNPGLTDFKFLVELCRRKQQLNYLQLSQILDEYQNIVLRLSQLKQKYLKLSKQQLIENDREYQQFLEYVLQTINAKDPNKIYKYSILRMNYILGDVESQKIGMSFGYLHMLGLNANLYGQLFLRKKAIDLANLNTKEELFAASIETLAQRLADITKGRKLQRRIKTVDGFPLLITETISRIKSPFNEYSLCEYEHLAFVNDYEINQESLQRLQEYRNGALIEAKNSITQEMMEEELSDQFEDIEYTLKAEEFMQKYYPQKIKNMHQNQRNNQISQIV